MIRLLTYCTPKYTHSAENLCLSAYKHGVDEAVIKREHDIPDLFRLMIGDNIKEINRHWFYIWKPFVVWEYMVTMPEGDVLIYADAGQTIVDSVVPLVDSMEGDVLLFHNPWKHVEWCKADVAMEINSNVIITVHQTNCGEFVGCNNDYIEQKQAQASLMFFRVNQQTRNFVKEWMLYCLMPGFCDNSPSKLPNYPTFQEHRYDQAVLTCVAIKHGIKLHEIPRIDNDNAAHKIVDHHRKSNEQW